MVLLIGFGSSSEQALSQPPEQDSETQVPTTPSDTSTDQVLIKTKENSSTAALEPINRKNNASTKKKIPHTRMSVIKLPKDLSAQEAVRLYGASPDVEYAEPDYKVHPMQTSPTPNDPNYKKIYGLNNIGQSGGTFDADVDAPEAWSATTGNASTVVAVIDTGIDINHPDLKDNIWVNPDEVVGNGVDDDRNGYVDDINGWDFYHEDNSVFDNPADDRHATHIAGTIAAEGNNSRGVVGVNWQAKIMSAKFIGPNDTGYVSDAIEAINYAVGEGAMISNNSWSLSPYSRALRDTIRDADSRGHLFIAAAANDAQDNDVTPVYPSGYDSSNIISVAASDDNDSLASFSNYGATSVDLAAPGVSILSTFPRNTYGYGYGTSMATPHVAGAAALIKAKFPTLSDNQIKSRILDNVDPKSSLTGKTVTGGRLSVARALGVPTISSTNPAYRATGVSRDTSVTATFSEDMDPTTLSTTTVGLYQHNKKKKKWLPVSVAVTVSTDGKSATLDPYPTDSSELLAANTKYKVTVTTGVKDKAGDALAQNYSWTFTTNSS